MIRFILNPNSGTPAGRERLLRTVAAACARLGPNSADLRVTQHAGHARSLAEEAGVGGMERVIAVGGDGTVNEIAGALAGSATALAIVPCGSGNGLARHFGLPLNAEAALALATAKDVRLEPMDLGFAGSHCFVNALGLGFDAELARMFNLSKRRGFATYLWLGLRLWVRFEPQAMSIRAGNGQTLKTRCLLLAIANSSQYGNGAQIAPWARSDDGLLEAVALAPANPFALALDALRLFRGRIRESPRVSVLQAKTFEVESSAGCFFHLDGEVRQSETGVLQVEARKASLQVVVG